MEQTGKSGISEQLEKLLSLLAQGREVAAEIIGEAPPRVSDNDKAVETPDTAIDRAEDQLRRAVAKADVLVEQVKRIESRF